jgi:hypothetical protein
VSYATAIVSSPRAFDWVLWVCAAVLVLLTFALRRGIGRAWASLFVYLFFSILTLALSRVPIIGSVAGLETRYLADAVVPLVVVVGMCMMPLQGERNIWLPLPLTVTEEVFHRARVVAGSVIAVSVFALSLHALNGYAGIQASNPYERFTEKARGAVATLPPAAQVFDTGMPVDVIGPLFLEYNLISRFLSPFASDSRREQMYDLDSYTDPYLLRADGDLVPMKVAGVSTPESKATSCGWMSKDGAVTVPLKDAAFPWTWAVRIGYLSDRDTTATVVLGKGSHPVQLKRGLGEIYLSIEGGGSALRLEGLDPYASVCVGDAQVGQAVPK